jgi:hypothetical protein
MPATAQNPDKSRKQLYIVVGLGVVFAVIVAIQAPRLLGGGATEATPSTTTGSPPAASQETGAPSAPGAVSFSDGANLGGVEIVPAVVSKPGEGQLASFSLFDHRDPFVQLVKEIVGEGGSQDGEPAGVKVSGGAGSGAPGAPGAAGVDGAAGATGTPGTPVTTGSSGSVSSSSSGLSTATIWVNGAEESVEVKKKFPKTDPTFVLLSLKPKLAQIGVVGGAFTGGGTIALKMGQTLTLVNTATGARYTLKLLYSGSAPETVQQFTQAEK